MDETRDLLLDLADARADLREASAADRAMHQGRVDAIRSQLVSLGVEQNRIDSPMPTPRFASTERYAPAPASKYEHVSPDKLPVPWGQASLEDREQYARIKNYWKSNPPTQPFMAGGFNAWMPNAPTMNPDLPTVRPQQSSLSPNAAVFSNADAPLSLRGQQHIHSAGVSPATFGGQPMYGVVGSPVNAAPPRLGYDTVKRENGVEAVDLGKYGRGGYRSKDSDDFASIERRFNAGQLDDEQYGRAKDRLFMRLDAVKYSGARMPFKANKYMMNSPVSGPERAVGAGVDREESAVAAFPAKSVYTRGAGDPSGRYEMPTQAEYEAGMARTQQQLRSAADSQHVLNSVSSDIGRVVRNAGFANGQVPSSQAAQYAPWFDEVRLLAAQSIVANSGSSYGRVDGAVAPNQSGVVFGRTTSMLDLLDRAAAIGSEQGMPGHNYATPIRAAASQFAQGKTFDELLAHGIERGFLSKDEAQSARADSTSATGQPRDIFAGRDRLAEMLVTRSLTQGSYGDLVVPRGLDEKTEADQRAQASKLQRHVGSYLQRIEAERTIAPVGFASGADRPSARDYDATDHESDNRDAARFDSAEGTSEGEHDWNDGNRVSAASDANDARARKGRDRGAEYGQALSNLQAAMDQGRQGRAPTNVMDIGVYYDAERNVTLLRRGRKGAVLGQRSSVAGLDDFRGTYSAAIDPNVSGTHDSDPAVNAAMAGRIDAPNVAQIWNAWSDEKKAQLGMVGARRLSAEIGRYRRDHADRLGAVQGTGDVRDWERENTSNDANADPSTAQQELGADYDLVTKFETSGGFQADPLALLMRQSGLASGVALNRKESQLLGGRKFVNSAALSYDETRELALRAVGAGAVLSDAEKQLVDGVDGAGLSRGQTQGLLIRARDVGLKLSDKETQAISRREQLSLEDIAHMLVKAQGTYKSHENGVPERIYQYGKSAGEVAEQNESDIPVFTGGTQTIGRNQKTKQAETDEVYGPMMAKEYDLTDADRETTSLSGMRTALTRYAAGEHLNERGDALHPAVAAELQRMVDANEKTSTIFGLSSKLADLGLSESDVADQEAALAGFFAHGARHANVERADITAKHARSMDDAMLHRLRTAAEGLGDDTGDDALMAAYQVSDPQLARVFHTAATSGGANLRESLSTALGYHLADTGESMQSVYQRSLKVNRELQVPQSLRWMSTALDFANAGDEKGLRGILDTNGAGHLAALGLGDAKAALQQQMLLASITRTGDPRNFASFGDADKNLNFTGADTDVSEWLKGQADMHAFINGVGTPGTNANDQAKNSRKLLSRLALLADPAAVTEDKIEGASDKKIGRGDGFASPSINGVRETIFDAVRGAQRDLPRLNAMVDATGSRAARVRAWEARKGVQPYLGLLKKVGYGLNSDGAARDRLDELLEQPELFAGRKGGAEILTGMQKLQGFWMARAAGQDAREGAQGHERRIAELRGIAGRGQRVLDTLADDGQKEQLAQFIEASTGILSEKRRGVSISYDPASKAYSRTRIRGDFENQLKGGTSSEAIDRIHALIEAHDQFRASGRDGQAPTITRGIAAQVADAMGARKTFLSAAFDQAKARGVGNNFVYGRGAANGMGHDDAVGAAIIGGLGEQAGDSRNLNDAQRAVLNSNPYGLTTVAAGPGVGKTTVAVPYLKQLAAAEGDHEVVALGFARKAADELRARIGDQPEGAKRVHVSTIDAEARGIWFDRLGDGEREAVTGIKGWQQPAGREAAEIGASVTRMVSDGRGDSSPSDISINNVMGNVLKRLDPELVGRAMSENRFANNGDGRQRFGQELYRRITAQTIGGYLGGELSDAQSKQQGLAAIDHAVGQGMQELHGLYASENYADMTFMKAAATRLLTSNARVREGYSVDRTVGVIDEAQDMNDLDRRFLAARMGRGALAIGDMAQNVGVGFRHTLLNFGKAMRETWADAGRQVNEPLTLMQSNRQGVASAKAVSAVLNQELQGDTRRDGALAYTAYNNLGDEIQGQVGHFLSMLDNGVDLASMPNGVGFFSGTNANVNLIRAELNKHAKGRGFTVAAADDENVRGPKVVVDTIHGVKGATFDVSFGVGFGTGDNQLARRGDVVSTPAEIQAAIESGEADPSRLQSIQTGFMTHVALSRANTTVLSGTGEASEYVRPAIAALRDHRGDVTKTDYTIAEALPASRGADKDIIAMGRFVHEDSLRAAITTQNAKTVTQDQGQLIPAGFELQQGKDPLLAVEARQVVQRPSDEAAFLAAVGENRPGMGVGKRNRLPVSWDEMQGILAGDTSAIARPKAFGMREVDGELKGSPVYEAYLPNSKSDLGHATGVLLDFGAQRNQRPFRDVNALSDADVGSLGFTSSAELGAHWAATNAPDALNATGAPTAYRAQSRSQLDRNGVAPDAAFLNQFSVAGVAPEAAAFAKELQRGTIPLSARPDQSQARPATTPALAARERQIEDRGAYAVDTRYLLSGDPNDPANPWAEAMSGWRNKGGFSRRANTGTAVAVSSQEQYDALVAKGYTGIDASGEAWASPDTANLDEYRTRNKSRIEQAAMGVANAIGSGRFGVGTQERVTNSGKAIVESRSLLRQVGSAIGQGGNAVVMVPDGDTRQVVNTLFHAQGVSPIKELSAGAQQVAATILSQKDRGNKANHTAETALGDLIRRDTHTFEGENNDGIGQRTITDNKHVIAFTGPRGGNNENDGPGVFTGQDWHAARER